MKIIEECTGSFILPRNVNYLNAKKQLTSLPRVKIFNIYFSKKRKIQRKVRMLNKAKGLTPMPLSKKLELCFGKASSKVKSSRDCFNTVCGNTEKDSCLLKDESVKSSTEGVVSNYVCLVDKNNPRIILRKEQHQNEERMKKNKYSMFLKKNKEANSHEKNLSPASKVDQSIVGEPKEDALTINLRDRLRKRKRAARNSTEISEKLDRQVGESDEGGIPVKQSRSDTSHARENQSPDMTSQPKNPYNLPDMTSQEDLNLEKLVEKMLKKSDWPDATAVGNFKKGICPVYLENDFSCMEYPCKYEHDVRELFRKKLETMPSLLLIQMVMAMKDDIFFIEALLEGFDILKNRKNFVKHLPFVFFFAFYVSGPNSAVLESLWTTAAEHFIKSSDNPTDDFAYLFKVFGQIDRSSQPKMINFIKEVLVSSPFNFKINWKLLQPVIRFKIPTNLLVEAVDSCNKSKLYIREINDEITSRIVVNNLAIQQVEILLEFCETLKNAGELARSAGLKLRLRSKVQSLEPVIDQNHYPKTYLFHREISVKEANKQNYIDDPEEEEERKLKSFLKVENKGFSQIGKTINPLYFAPHESLPMKLEQRKVTGQSVHEGNMKQITCEAVDFGKLLLGVVDDMKNFRFTAVGENLNFFHIKYCLTAAEKIVETIFNLSFNQPEAVINFFCEVSFNCSSKNSWIIISCVAMTMITFFLEKVKADWNMAYSIFKTCNDEGLDISCGEVFSRSDSGKKSLQSKTEKVLLLLEICLNCDQIDDAFCLIEKFNLFSSKGTDSTIVFDYKVNKIRESLLKDFMDKIIHFKSTERVHDTFMKIWQSQGAIDKDIDLREYASECIILLFNDNMTAATNFYEEILPYSTCLKTTAIRTIIVELVRLSRIAKAKSLMQSYFQTTYRLPLINDELMELHLPTYFTKEEIFVVLDLFLDKLAKKFTETEEQHFNINILLEKCNFLKEVITMPRCLDEDEEPILLNSRRKLNQVLNESFSSLIIRGFGSKLSIDSYSLQEQIKNRIYEN